MMDSNEPIQKIEPSDDESINLTRMPGYEIIMLAKGIGGDRSNWSKQLDEFAKFIAIAILIGPILLDTLFLYVPIINENIKCLALDDKLKIIAIVLRSFTDLPFLLNLLRHVLPTWYTSYILEVLLDDVISESRMLNILAVLPIPQVVILIFLPKTRNSRSLNRMKFLNSLILLQYVPRAYPMYKICKHSNKDTREGSTELARRKQIWISGVLNFIMYILASHTFMLAISRIWQRMRVIHPRIEFMVSEYGLTGEWVEYAIWKLVREALEEDEGRAAENIFSLLPRELQRRLKCHLFLATLTKLPGLENKDRQVLDAIMKDLEPVSYADGTYIIREGEPLDRMLFITQGIALAYKTGTTGGESGSSSTAYLEKGDVYGKELIGWAATSTPFSGLPISGQTVKSHEKVEVFAIRAARLKSIVSKFSTHFNTEDITMV